MKKIGLFIMLLLVVSMLIGCSETSGQQTAQNIPSVNDSVESTGESNSQQEDEWQVTENILTEKNGVRNRAHIKLPSLAAISEGTGKIAYQTDGTLVILDAQYDGTTVDNDIKTTEVFPAYFEQTKGIMMDYRTNHYDDFDFSIQNKNEASVNGYDMCKVTGVHTFSLNGEAKQMNFVAYATKLKSNDAVVYWMVIDESDDQSLGGLIESHAEKIAQYLSE